MGASLICQGHWASWLAGAGLAVADGVANAGAVVTGASAADVAADAEATASAAAGETSGAVMKLMAPAGQAGRQSPRPSQ